MLSISPLHRTSKSTYPRFEVKYCIQSEIGFAANGLDLVGETVASMQSVLDESRDQPYSLSPHKCPAAFIVHGHHSPDPKVSTMWRIFQQLG